MLGMVVTESWKTHEDREYGVNHTFDCVADHRRFEWTFGSMNRIPSLTVLWIIKSGNAEIRWCRT